MATICRCSPTRPRTAALQVVDDAVATLAEGHVVARRDPLMRARGGAGALLDTLEAKALNWPREPLPLPA